MMATKVRVTSYEGFFKHFFKMREAEIEEAENFIPCCFRAFRDQHGETLKDSTISVEHFRYVMRCLPIGAWRSRRGDKIGLF